MNFEKAKEIQEIMNEVGRLSQCVVSSQTQAAAVILNAITTEEEYQDDIDSAFFELLAFSGELKEILESLENVIGPFMS